MLFKFGLQNLGDLLCLLQLEVGAGGDFLDGKLQHALGGVAPDVLEGLDDPRFDFVGELREGDILLLDLAVDVDVVTGEHLGKADVQTPLADGQRHLVGLEVDGGGLLLLVEDDGRNLGGVQRTLNHQLRVGREVDDVDVLVAQLLDDGIDARTLHADACTDGVDAVVVGFDRDLGPLAGDADDFLDGDQTVGNLGNLLLEQTFEELAGCAREDDAGLVVVHLDRLDDGFDGVALAIEIVGNLLAFGENQLVLVVVENQHLLFPDLVNLAGDDFADFLGILLVKVGLFEVEDARSEVLPERQDGTAPERRELDFIGILVADLVGGVDGLDLRNGDLRIGILDGSVLDDRAVAPDFEVALLGVDDDVEILVALVLLLQGVAEDVLQHADHGGLVDVLQLLELGEVADKIEIVHGVIVCFVFF